MHRDDNITGCRLEQRLQTVLFCNPLSDEATSSCTVTGWMFTCCVHRLGLAASHSPSLNHKRLFYFLNSRAARMIMRNTDDKSTEAPPRPGCPHHEALAPTAASEFLINLQKLDICIWIQNVLHTHTYYDM